MHGELRTKQRKCQNPGKEPRANNTIAIHHLSLVDEKTKLMLTISFLNTVDRGLWTFFLPVFCGYSTETTCWI